MDEPDPTRESQRTPAGPWPAGVGLTPLDSAELSPDSTVAFHSVGFTLSTTGYAVARRFSEVLAPMGLVPRDFALLRSVAAHEGESQHAVGARLNIQPSRMVAFVDALEARGLLERRHNPHDRRTRALHLTDAGRELLGLAFAEAVNHERELCADLSEQEREQLLGLLQRVAGRLGLTPGVHAALGHSTLDDEPAPCEDTQAEL